MEFITTGNRIAVENFDIGKIYTITWETGNYKNLACTGKGTDFVMFQDQEPDLLFCLTMDSAISVSSIDEGGSGGTNNYNELENKPSINGFVLVGNKTGAELGLASQSDLEDYATNASVVAGLAGKQDALSSAQLQAVNSGITSALVTQIGTNTSAIAGKQDALSSAQLQAVNSGITSALVTQIGTNTSTIAGKQDALSSAQLAAVNSGITSALVTQIGTNTSAIAGKQNALSSSQLAAVNSGITAADVAQITTNKNNILTLESKNGSKNYLNYDKTILQSLNTGGSWVDNVWTMGNGVTLTVNADNSITLNGTSTAGKTIYLAKNLNITSDTYILSMTTPLISKLWAGMSAVGGGEYNFTSPNSYISQSCQPNNITVYIDNGCVLDNITLYPMLCDDESWSLSHNYQQYAMSNAEITAWIKAHT